MDPVHRILASLRDKPLKELMLGKEDWNLGSRTDIQLNQSNHTEDGLHPTIETANRPLIGVMIKTSVSIMAQDVTHILPRGDQTYKQTVMGTHVHRLETDCLSLKIALGLRKQETSIYREYLKEVNGGQYKKALPHVNLTSHILPLLDPTENRCTPPVLELVKTYIGLVIVTSHQMKKDQANAGLPLNGYLHLRKGFHSFSMGRLILYQADFKA